MDKNSEDKKQHMTDEERLELCKKLDQELDEFIEKLPKKKYTDGWPEDKWQEEIEKHPFFMKKAPEPGEELHPLYEGLQKLKYDPDENTPEDLALSYKEDGNFNFKHKNYRLAILSYTEGIKVKCNNPEIEATLYNNRAASHYFLKNYRSCLRDCEIALKFKPNYDKVLTRAANACFQMNQYQKVIDYCESILEKDVNNKDVQELRQKSFNAMKLLERDRRKKELLTRNQERDVQLLLEEIQKRKLKFDSNKLSIESLQPVVLQLADSPVHLDESNSLVWPVTFVYPEYQIMDFVQTFCETDRLIDQLFTVFDTQPEWDCEHKYRPDAINVYFETKNSKIFKLDATFTLQQVLQHKEYVIKGGTPSFILLPRDGLAEKEFLSKYKFLEYKCVFF